MLPWYLSDTRFPSSLRRQHLLQSLQERAWAEGYVHFKSNRMPPNGPQMRRMNFLARPQGGAQAAAWPTQHPFSSLFPLVHSIAGAEKNKWSLSRPLLQPRVAKWHISSQKKKKRRYIWKHLGVETWFWRSFCFSQYKIRMWVPPPLLLSFFPALSYGRPLETRRVQPQVTNQPAKDARAEWQSLHC